MRRRSSRGSGELEWLLGRFVELVDEDALEAGASGVVELAAGEGEQYFAGESGCEEHGRAVRDVPGERGG